MLQSKNLLFSCIVSVIVAGVAAYNGIRGQRHYLTRRALVHPKFSPWRRLLNYGDEGSFLNVTGFSFESFRELVNLLKPRDTGIPKMGRPKYLNIEDELGIEI